MYRKKSANNNIPKQLTDGSTMLLRDSSTRKMSIGKRAEQAIDKYTNMSTQLPRKLSTSNIKSDLKELEQLQKKAIRHFYSKDHDSSFEMLDACQKLSTRIDASEHRIYVHYLYTEFHFKLGQYDNSLQHYRLSRQIHCNPIQHRKLSGYLQGLDALYLAVLFQKGQHCELVLAADSITQKMQEGSRAWLQCQYNKMKALVETNKMDQAKEIAQCIIEKSIKLDDQQRYYMKVIDYLEQKGLLDIAIDILELMVRLSPQHPQIINSYARLADLNIRRKNIIGAIYNLEMVRRVSSLQNLQQKSLVLLAQLYSEVGNHERCLEILRQLSSQAASELMLEAATLVKLNRSSSAVKLYRKLLDDEANSPNRLNLYTKILSALPANCDEAESYQQELLDQALQTVSGESIVAVTELANTLRKRGYFDRAEYFYKQAAILANNINLPQYHFIILSNLGEMLQELNRRSDSLVYYNKALRLKIQHALSETIQERVRQLRTQL